MKAGYVAIHKDGGPFAYYSDDILKLIYEVASEEGDIEDYEICRVGPKVYEVKAEEEDNS